MIMSTVLKFNEGSLAREKWSKTVDVSSLMSMAAFNLACGGVFSKAASIQLDPGPRQTVIQAVPIDETTWNENREKIYTIVKQDKIVKIGGTRNGMKARFGSYLCGHHVSERGKSGKMSVTNAHLYHTIEKDLLDGDSTWEFYTWTLPVVENTINILGTEIKVVAQTYHVYESCCIKKYKDITGTIPLLCDNSDPQYK